MKNTWHGSRPDNPIDGDCYLDADESMVYAFFGGKWFAVGPLDDTTNIVQRLREEKINKLTDGE